MKAHLILFAAIFCLSALIHPLVSTHNSTAKTQRRDQADFFLDDDDAADEDGFEIVFPGSSDLPEAIYSVEAVSEAMEDAVVKFKIFVVLQVRCILNCIQGRNL